MLKLEKTLASAYLDACLMEIEALKPGNVHVFADGHGMVVQDFIKSAEVSSKVIAKSDLTLGERVFQSLQVTWHAVECNTNLGIILLCAPLIQAAYLQPQESFVSRLKHVLSHTTGADAQRVFDAIKLASPAGLGQSDQHDVHQSAEGTLLEAMQAASARDTIALQYSNNYHQICNEGLPYYQKALERWQKPAWAVTALYLYWLANYSDSHISRKYNDDLAIEVSALAKVHEAALIKLDNPKLYFRKLFEFDVDLKKQRINPGTSADLTVATLLLNHIQNHLS